MKIRVKFHGIDPSIVNMVNLKGFILKIPAGSEITVLIMGSILPIKTAISPYLLNNSSPLENSLIFMKKYLPYFKMKLRPPYNPAKYESQEPIKLATVTIKVAYKIEAISEHKVKPVRGMMISLGTGRHALSRIIDTKTPLQEYFLTS